MNLNDENNTCKRFNLFLTIFTGEDYDGLFNLIEQNDNANTLFIEPKIQNFEKSVKDYDKNFDDFIFKEEGPVKNHNKNIDVTKCEQEFECEKSNGINSIENVEKDFKRSEIIDEVRQTLCTYFKDFDRQLQNKRRCKSNCKWEFILYFSQNNDNNNYYYF